MKYNFDEVINRKGTYSMKWDGGEWIKSFGITERFDEETIPVFTADMDFQSPQPVIDALHKVVDHNMFGYSAHIFVPEYYEAIIKWFKEKRNWEIKKEEITYVNGTVEALKLAIEAFTDKGDGVIIQRPVYGPFTSTIIKTHRTIVNNQLINNDGYYTMDFDDLEEKAKDPNTKMLLLCNPHNPVGRIWSVEELQKLSEICRKNDILIVADEIHGDLLRVEKTFTPMASVADNSNIITCTAVNKTFNLAGLQCTNVIIANSNLREIFNDYIGFILPSPFAIGALIAAYNEGDDWLNQILEYIDGNIDWILGFLKERMPKVKCFRPEATYIMWMDFGAYGLTPEEIHKKIYVDANVVLEGGSMFDPNLGQGFERICVPASRTVIEEVFNRIAKQFEGL